MGLLSLSGGEFVPCGTCLNCRFSVMVVNGIRDVESIWVSFGFHFTFHLEFRSSGGRCGMLFN